MKTLEGHGARKSRNKIFERLDHPKLVKIGIVSFSYALESGIIKKNIRVFTWSQVSQTLGFCC